MCVCACACACVCVCVCLKLDKTLNNYFDTFDNSSMLSIYHNIFKKAMIERAY